MKTRSVIVIGLLVLLGGASALRAEITVRLSVKFILNFNGTPPSAGNIGTIAGFSNEVVRGNLILAATGRAFKLQVVEYLNIQPSAPAGSNASYWYNLPARANRATIENAALADQATWRWNGNTLNMFVNNSSSGQCSFIGGGSSISFGATIGAGTVLHETGHFFDLRHTHAGDYNNNYSNATYTAANLQDGDGLIETANDNPNIATKDQLCGALFGTTYAAATAQQQAIVDSAFENVMSYHNENALLSVQMDIWNRSGNGARLFACTGRTWFVAIGGSDGDSGDNAGSPFGTLQKGLSSVSSGDDVILMRGGNYNSPANGVINTRCTLSATRGGISIRKP